MVEARNNSTSYDTFYKTDRNFTFKMPTLSTCITPELPSDDTIILDPADQKLYGRCPLGFKKISVLGRGGCAVVWLCKKDERHFAVKQFPKSSMFY